MMNKGGVQAGGYGHGVDETYNGGGGDQRFLVGKKVAFKDVRTEDGGEKLVVKDSCNNQRKVSCSDDESSSSTSSSSIGKNSDISDDSLEKSGNDEEVESSYKQGPLDAMEALEEVLPIRRGLSRFYKGKSKSFASLADEASLPSIKDIAKPGNAYTRRCRNVLASKLILDTTTRSGSSPLGGNGGGISKRVTSSGKTTLALAVAMSNSENRRAQKCNPTVPLLKAPSSKSFSAWRSFSFADLQNCVSNSK